MPLYMNANQTIESATQSLHKGLETAGKVEHQAVEVAGQAAKRAAAAAESGLSQSRDYIKDAYRSAATTAGNALEQGKQIADQTLQSAKGGAERLVNLAQNCIERNPWLAVFGSLGIGFFAGHFGNAPAADLSATPGQRSFAYPA